MEMKCGDQRNNKENLKKPEKVNEMVIPTKNS